MCVLDVASRVSWVRDHPDELHMELIHYADKLKDLRQGRRRSLGFQGSALNRNADKHSALVKEVHCVVAICGVLGLACRASHLHQIICICVLRWCMVRLHAHTTPRRVMFVLARVTTPVQQGVQ